MLIYMKKIIFLFFVTFLFVLNLSNAVGEEAAEDTEEIKDCVYCLQYEKLLDWPIEERPGIFVYQENISYPKGMFGMENKLRAAGKKVAYRFVKKKKSLGKHPGPMLMDMAYFEVLFNEMLNNITSDVEKIEKLLKVRSAFRQSLNISPTATSEEAILKFYSLGKMMRSAKKKKQKVDDELLTRKQALEQLKQKVVLTKQAIKVEETSKKVEEVKEK